MIVYTPIFYCAELKLAFKGKLTWKVADTLQYKHYYIEVFHIFYSKENYLFAHTGASVEPWPRKVHHSVAVRWKKYGGKWINLWMMTESQSNASQITQGLRVYASIHGYWRPCMTTTSRIMEVWKRNLICKHIQRSPFQNVTPCSIFLHLFEINPSKQNSVP